MLTSRRWHVSPSPLLSRVPAQATFEETDFLTNSVTNQGGGIAVMWNYLDKKGDITSGLSPLLTP